MDTTRELLNDFTVDGMTVRVEIVREDGEPPCLVVSGLDCNLEGEMPGEYYLTPAAA